jgi:hypothetical protein
MKTMCRVSLALALVAMCGSAFGQTVNSTSNSQVSSGAMSSAANQGNNQGQDITFNSPATPTHTTETVRSAPSMGLGSFGTSFSSDNCSNTIAGQASVIGVGASFGKALMEQNCAKIRRGFAFGQAAAFAAQNGQKELALREQAMVNYEFCTTDADTQQACEDMGLIKKASNDKDRKEDYQPVTTDFTPSLPQQVVSNQPVSKGSWQSQPWVANNSKPAGH